MSSMQSANRLKSKIIFPQYAKTVKPETNYFAAQASDHKLYQLVNR